MHTHCRRPQSLGRLLSGIASDEVKTRFKLPTASILVASTAIMSTAHGVMAIADGGCMMTVLEWGKKEKNAYPYSILTTISSSSEPITPLLILSAFFHTRYNKNNNNNQNQGPPGS